MLLKLVTLRPAAVALALALLVTGVRPIVPSEAAPEPVRVRASETTGAIDGQSVFVLDAGTTHIAIHWRGHRDARLTAAFSRDGATFGEPQAVTHDEYGEEKHDGRTYGSVMVVNGARAVRVTVDEPLDDVTVVSMDAAQDVEPAAGLGTTVAGLTAPPSVISRAGWGADETIRFQPDGEEAWWSQYFPLQKLVVHHTAGTNNDPNPAATVRAIYRYHAVTQGWGDIGYNYLIDSAGRIYEGRHSRDYWYGAQPTSDDGQGNVIAGGHALYHNAGTMGIALLGNFTSVAPTSAARSGLVSLLTWAADEHDINPLGATTYLNPANGYSRTTYNIAGHRDYNQTGCPGAALYNLLPSIRSAVAAGTSDWSGETYNPPRSVAIAAGQHVGYRFNAAGGVIGSTAFTLTSPSSAPASTRATIPSAGSGEWYFITSGLFAGHWLAASSKVVLGPPAPTVEAESYRPFAPLYLNPGTYVGYRFNTWGGVTGSRTMIVSSPTWVPVQERSTIPGQGVPWYYVTAGTLATYWIPESGSTSLGSLPMASFSASQTSGLAPLAISFLNASATWGNASWAWDFNGDGLTDSTLQNPTFVYPVAGTYSVSLTVTDSAGSDTMTRTDYVTVRTPQVGTYVPVEPARVLDTRTGTGLSGQFTVGAPRSFPVAGLGGVPPGAIAVTGTVTVTGQTAAGYLAVGPDPVFTPTSSTVNFPIGDTRANGVTVALGPDGSLSATLGSANFGARTHVVFDVTGYFMPDTSGATFLSLPPTRLVDTRAAIGLSGPFTAQVPRAFQVSGLAGVPVEAVAVTGILTVTGQSGSGFYSLGPATVPSPSSSTLNFPMGDTRATGVTVALGPGGTLSATLSGANRAELVFDVTGYFVPGSSGASYVALSPSRLLDTRVATGLSGPFAAHTPRTFGVSGLGGVPSDAAAVTGTLTAIGQTGAGYVYLGPDPLASPTTSTLNFPWGDVRANGVTVALGTGGTLSGTFLPAGTVHLLWDVSGYFFDASP